MPASVMNSVAMITKKRLRADQSMMVLNMSVPRVWIAGSCSRFGLQLGNHPFARLALDYFKRNGSAWLNSCHQRWISQCEIHRHPRPAQHFDRAVRDVDRTVCIEGIQRAFRLIAHRGWLRLICSIQCSIGMRVPDPAECCLEV